MGDPVFEQPFPGFMRTASSPIMANSCATTALIFWKTRTAVPATFRQTSFLNQFSRFSQKESLGPSATATADSKSVAVSIWSFLHNHPTKYIQNIQQCYPNFKGWIIFHHFPAEDGPNFNTIAFHWIAVQWYQDTLEVLGSHWCQQRKI